MAPLRRLTVHRVQPRYGVRQEGDTLQGYFGTLLEESGNEVTRAVYRDEQPLQNAFIIQTVTIKIT